MHNRLLARNTDNVDSSTGFTGGIVIYINRLLARNTANVDSSTGFTDGVVIYITDN